MTRDKVNHPQHYGGEDDLYEAIKVIEAWRLDFRLGNTVKYICRAGRKPDAALLEDLRKAAWYLNRFIQVEGERLEREAALVEFVRKENPSPTKKEAAPTCGTLCPLCQYCLSCYQREGQHVCPVEPRKE